MGSPTIVGEASTIVQATPAEAIAFVVGTPTSGPARWFLREFEAS